jgi:hypothetical protein
MARIGYTAAETLVNILRSSSGVASTLAQISEREDMQLPTVGADQIIGHNVSIEIAEKGKGFQYPALYVYCDKVQNPMREKFRLFSGVVRLNVEVRASKESVEGLERLVHMYVDAVTGVLLQSRGDWGQGISYSGEYEVQFSSAKVGGSNYVQAAKIILDVAVSQG